MSLTIRPVTASDWPTFAQIYPAYIAELPTESGDTDDMMPWLRSQFDLALQGQRYIWFAYDGERLVGSTMFAVFENFPGSSNKFGILMDFYIVPQARRQGWGQELARAAFAKMRAEGADNVELNVLLENHRGLAFWESLGLHTHHHVLKMPLQDVKE